MLEHPIKTTGEHEVPIKLHHDVTAKFKFNVKSSEEPKPEAPAEESADKSRGPRKRHEINAERFSRLNQSR